MEEELIRFCAPTLAGIKSAGAFGYPYFDVYALQNRIQRLNQRLLPKGVLILPLRLKEGRALIYAFRPSMLPVDLSHPIAQRN